MVGPEMIADRRNLAPQSRQAPVQALRPHRLIPPARRDQVAGGDHIAGIGQQHTEDQGLLRRQLDRNASPGQRPPRPDKVQKRQIGPAILRLRGTDARVQPPDTILELHRQSLHTDVRDIDFCELILAMAPRPSDRSVERQCP